MDALNVKIVKAREKKTDKDTARTSDKSAQSSTTTVRKDKSRKAKSKYTQPEFLKEIDKEQAILSLWLGKLTDSQFIPMVCPGW